MILFYSKGAELDMESRLSGRTTRNTSRQFYRHEDEDGRRYTLGDLTEPRRQRPEPGDYPTIAEGIRPPPTADIGDSAPRRRWTSYDPKDGSYLAIETGGPAIQALPGRNDRRTTFRTSGTDIPPINAQAQERLGYPTQKPEALLERIIKASSNEGDLVLDPFCGCGTTVQVAQRLNRRWIGIDITHLAIGLIKKRLSDAFGPEIKSTYEVIGEPTDYAGAAQLAAEDKYQFQWWALGQVGARPADQKKGADRGIDGRLYFHDDDSGKSKQIIFSVKAGGVSVSQVRDLRGVLEREKAEIGVFLCFEEPTKPMKHEAAEAGFYKSSDGSTYPRLQILTIQQILDGKQPDYPAHRRDATFKKAPRSRPAPAENLTLPLLPGED